MPPGAETKLKAKRWKDIPKNAETHTRMLSSLSLSLFGTRGSLWEKKIGNVSNGFSQMRDKFELVTEKIFSNNSVVHDNSWMKVYTDCTLLINVPRTVSILTYYHALEVVTISVDLLNVRTVAPNSSSSVTSSLFNLRICRTHHRYWKKYGDWKEKPNSRGLRNCFDLWEQVFLINWLSAV